MSDVEEQKPAEQWRTAAKTAANKLHDQGPYHDRGSLEPNLLKTYDRPSGYEDRKATPSN